MSGEWTIGANRAAGVALWSNKDGWTRRDLSELAGILQRNGVQVEDTDDLLVQQSTDLIPWLVFGLGFGFGSFFSGFLGEAGADAYRALKDALVKKARHFETLNGFRFHKHHFNGVHRGVNVSASINASDHEGVLAAVSKWGEVVPLIENAIDTLGAENVEVLNVMYSETGGKWVFNHAIMKNGPDVRGPEQHLLVQDALRDMKRADRGPRT